ncbi:class I SAM-dependent methyltransferase [Conexibacter woesei]|uniref:Methyltransferase type 12 n=1 Tax=Conexibacter woesei (strain DSM 14684 / CCUG 47730 / CIP 108061 / JCM 11494 / NBRC 100937 / ID131577) TaxID=469383 RepID=D3F847_CONWI|nr:class I SAM-dependent methyltransferase [Conexibacter woesei]ADB48917.1 Methyltransferase type 12 [Conexibacter woesei DSM 14684]
MTEHANDVAQHWESFYDGEQHRWSGKPNRSLVDEIAAVAPGSALDLGCGEGGDAIWLAARGWTVTAVDISHRALEVAAGHAAAAGVADRITWERHDLAASLPAGSFDLVAATYLHSPVALPRTEILRTAAAAVAAGGTLLVIGHAPSAAHPHHDLPGPQEVVDELALPADRWQLRTSELRTVEHAFGDEAPTTRIDGVVRLQRA